MTDLSGHLGCELDGAGPGADHRDPAPGEVVVAVPAGRVEYRTLEGIEAFEGGDVGPNELAQTRDHDVDDNSVTG